MAAEDNRQDSEDSVTAGQGLPSDGVADKILAELMAEVDRTLPPLLEQLQAEYERTMPQLLEQLQAHYDRTMPPLLEHLMADCERIAPELWQQLTTAAACLTAADRDRVVSQWNDIIAASTPDSTPAPALRIFRGADDGEA